MRTFKPGDKVVYFHSFFNRRFDATVTKVTKTRVTIALDHPPAGVQRERSIRLLGAAQVLD